MIRISPTYPLAAVIAVCALLPLVVLGILAEAPDGLLQARNLRLLGNTLLLAGLTACGSIAIGVPFALLTAYVSLPLQRLWLVLLAAPLALPSYIGAFAFFAAFGPSGEFAVTLGVTIPSVEGMAGAALVMTLYTYPFVMLTTRAALLSLDASQVHAARILGLSLSASLWQVVLPRALRGIGAGALLAALYALSDFGTPAIMGVDTFTRMIYVEYNAFSLGRAAVLSLQLLVIVGLVLFLESQLSSTSERPGRALALYPTSAQTLSAAAVALPIILLALALPIGIFTLWLWREGSAGFELSYVWNSAYAALLAGGFAAILAIPMALAAMAGPAGRFMERLTYFGFGVPGIVMGTALVYVGLQLPSLYQTLMLLVAAYVMRFLPLAVGSLRATAEGIDESLVKAARVLGATPREAFMRVTLPLTRRGLIAGAALVFLESMRELPATLLLAPTGFETLATYLWRVYEAGYFGRAAVPGLLLVLISAFGLMLILSGEQQGDTAHREEECN
ncbi:ABC transporter permease [Halioglobus pacificus]|uniref:Iron ABC transporter permease n=1 Tax=Parahalioglobus pacificus TaxID=930806 RepID=A0A919CLY6_9GAMM|nr:iron ABC transporter permease [Halioglobus pacificus]GHD37239.1 iron ABC transporter permease [Halioglobus pacificus]